MSLLWTSWVRVWGWVSDRVIIDPLFVRMSHVLFAFIFRWARGARVSNGLFPFLGWTVCVVCPVAIAIV